MLKLVQKDIKIAKNSKKIELPLMLKTAKLEKIELPIKNS